MPFAVLSVGAAPRRRCSSGRPSNSCLRRDTHDEYEGLVETLNILSDTDAAAALAEAESDIEAGRLVDLH